MECAEHTRVTHLLRRAVVLRLEGKWLRCLRVAEVTSAREVLRGAIGLHLGAAGSAATAQTRSVGAFTADTLRKVVK